MIHVSTESSTSFFLMPAVLHWSIEILPIWNSRPDETRTCPRHSQPTQDNAPPSGFRAHEPPRPPLRQTRLGHCSQGSHREKQELSASEEAISSRRKSWFLARCLSLSTLRTLLASLLQQTRSYPP